MNMGEAPSLLRNDLKSTNHWVKVQLQGTHSNRERHWCDRSPSRPHGQSRSMSSSANRATSRIMIRGCTSAWRRKGRDENHRPLAERRFRVVSRHGCGPSCPVRSKVPARPLQFPCRSSMRDRLGCVSGKCDAQDPPPGSGCVGIRRSNSLEKSMRPKPNSSGSKLSRFRPSIFRRSSISPICSSSSNGSPTPNPPPARRGEPRPTISTAIICSDVHC